MRNQPSRLLIAGLLLASLATTLLWEPGKALPLETDVGLTIAPLAREPWTPILQLRFSIPIRYVGGLALDAAAGTAFSMSPSAAYRTLFVGGEVRFWVPLAGPLRIVPRVTAGLAYEQILLRSGGGFDYSDGWRTWTAAFLTAYLPSPSGGRYWVRVGFTPASGPEVGLGIAFGPL